MIKLPDEFLLRMKDVLGDDLPAFLEGLSEKAPVSLRLNPFKLMHQFDSAARVPWSSNGFYLDSRPAFTFDPLFQSGCYYVQEASSMYLEKIIRQIEFSTGNIRALDLCAAPGGKSTHLLSLLPAGSIVVCNEVIPSRNKILEHNLLKWGTPCILTQNKPADFARLENYFDLVLVDAPCSGEGLFRRDEEAIGEWSKQNVEHCVVRQEEILNDAIRCLKPGGFLIYSTCTFEKSENEEQVLKFSAVNDLEIISLESTDSGIVSSSAGLRFYSHRIKGEGLFYSLLRKKTDSESATEKNRKADRSHSKRDQEILTKYLVQPEKFVPHLEDERLFAVPEFMWETFQFLRTKMYLRNGGIFLGTWKQSDFLPSQDLAMSVHIRPDLPGKELDKTEAVRFLRCESIDSTGLVSGWNLVRFSGFNLGWIKALQNRSNNYFPKEWRIVSEKENS